MTRTTDASRELDNGANREQARKPLPARFSLAVNEERLARFLALPRAERIARALQWQLNLGEMLSWASRFPTEPPLVDGEWFFISCDLADCESYFHPTATEGEPAR
jgi:hypothetical protein